jgi:hypothetical protein
LRLLFRSNAEAQGLRQQLSVLIKSRRGNADFFDTNNQKVFCPLGDAFAEEPPGLQMGITPINERGPACGECG